MRTIQFFTAMTFCLCMVAFSSKTMAQFSGGDGTSETPYQITTAAELAQLATYVNAGHAIYAAPDVHYQLANNINLSAYSNWTPIGNTTTNPFKGVFDGDSKQISNLKITSGAYAGLFGCINNATVKNLGLINVDIIASTVARAGGLVGSNQGSVLNCHSTGIVKNYSTGSSSSLDVYAYIGGLIGDNQGSVLNCYSSCTINATTSVNSGMGNYLAHSRAGGMVGYNQSNGNMSNCYSTGTVTTVANCSITVTGNVYSYSYAGGIAGENIGIISNCYSIGDVSATAYSYAPNSTRSIYAYSRAGGVVGYNQGSGNVSNCYATGSVSASTTCRSTPSPIIGGTNSSYNYPYSYVGGVVGHNGSGSTVSHCAALNPKISCTSTSIDGRDNTTYRYFGRVVGLNAGTLTNNIAFIDMINPSNTTSWSNIGPSNLSGASYTKEDINNDGTLGNRFNTVWTTQSGKLPGLFGNTVNMPAHLYIAPTPPSITTTTLPDGIIGMEYSQRLSATGTMPIIWDIENGNLPNGLLLTGDTISGTPDTAGTFVFSVEATNSEGSDTKQLSITINKITQDAPLAPTLADKTSTNITLNTVSDCEYNINGGIWQSSPIFDELTPNTSYSFTQRKAETATHSASLASPTASFSTDKATLAGAVTINGNAIFGQTLTVDISNLTSTPTISNLGILSYQWQRGTTNIGTGSSYTLTQADIGSTITVTVTAANCDGSVTSNPTETITKATLEGTVTINGNAIFGETLTVNISNLTSTPTIPNLGILNYQWKRGTTNISTGSSYTLVQADIGNTITVTVTATNCDGSVTSTPTETITKATQTAPVTPTLNSSTSNSITLNSVADCEYRRGDENWQTLTTFIGLEPNTFYSFTQRKAETETHLASPESQAVTLKTDEESGINENLFGNIIIYPNPTDGVLRIESGDLKIESVEIYNTLGKTCLPSQSCGTTINISHLPSGTYFLKLKTNKGELTKKVIKE